MQKSVGNYQQTGDNKFKPVIAQKEELDRNRVVQEEITLTKALLKLNVEII